MVEFGSRTGPKTFEYANFVVIRAHAKAKVKVAYVSRHIRKVIKMHNITYSREQIASVEGSSYAAPWQLPT